MTELQRIANALERQCEQTAESWATNLAREDEARARFEQRRSDDLARIAKEHADTKAVNADLLASLREALDTLAFLRGAVHTLSVRVNALESRRLLGAVDPQLDSTGKPSTRDTSSSSPDEVSR